VPSTSIKPAVQLDNNKQSLTEKLSELSYSFVAGFIKKKKLRSTARFVIFAEEVCFVPQMSLTTVYLLRESTTIDGQNGYVILP
jgi:hypothetical protein